MTSRAWVVSVFISLLALDAVPQCAPATLYSGAFRTTIFDISIDGNDLWAATSYGVNLYDRGVDPPLLITGVGIPGITRVVKAAGGTAYIGSGSTIVVARRSGRAIQILRTLETGATVQDLVVTTAYLYAATTSGVMQFDLLNPINPQRTTAAFPTSSANTASLALLSNALIVADGDSTVEMFLLTVPTVPQKLADLVSLPRSIAVEASGNRIYISDSFNTDVFLTTSQGGTKVATMALAASSMAVAPGDVIFAAGNDRRVHAWDVSVPGSPVELFESELVPTGGSVNRISAIALAGSRVYAAGGDLGIAVYDISRFTAPYPLRSYATDPPTSIVIAGNRAYASRPAVPGGIQEFSIGATGGLTAQRQWESRSMLVQDGAPGLLLTSSGISLTLWTLNSTTPTLITTTTFRAPVISAVLIGSTAHVVLDDRTLWSADMSQATPTPRQIPIGSFRPTFIARSTAAISLTEVRTDGTTAIDIHSTNGLFTAPTRSVSIPGAVTSRPAMSPTFVAAFTFQGITLIDIASGATSVLPQSNSSLVQQVSFSGDSVIAVTGNSVRVWNASTKTLTRDVLVPANPTGLAATDDGVAVIRTTTGVISYDLRTASTQPTSLGAITGNSYYRKVIASGGRLYLFSTQGIDLYDTRNTLAPRYVTGIRGSFIDAGASVDRLYTLTSVGGLTIYSPDGARLLEKSITLETPDTRPLNLFVVGGVPWVSFSAGNLGGSNRTLVLDPLSLVRTAELIGSIVDVATSGTFAFTIMDLPAALQQIDITDPLHPLVRVSRQPEGTPAPVSIAASGNRVFAAGERLYVYDQSLTKVSEQLSSYQAEPSNSLSFVDQRLRATASCVLLTGRTFAGQSLAVPSLVSAATPPLPATARSIAIDGQKIYVLTDHSLEIWSMTPLPAAPLRRKPTR